MPPENISFYQSKNIHDYKEILVGLQDVFENEHWDHILSWCGILDNDDFGKHWRVWLIEVKSRVVGICGFYSFEHRDNSELWLDWFGILLPYRERGIGKVALEFMEMEAKKVGCKKLSSYVGDDAFKFYLSNGFKYITNVRQYSIDHPHHRDYFGELEDHIVSKNIDLTKSNNLL